MIVQQPQLGGINPGHTATGLAAASKSVPVESAAWREPHQRSWLSRRGRWSTLLKGSLSRRPPRPRRPLQEALRVSPCNANPPGLLRGGEGNCPVNKFQVKKGQTLTHFQDIWASKSYRVSGFFILPSKIKALTFLTQHFF